MMFNGPFWIVLGVAWLVGCLSIAFYIRTNRLRSERDFWRERAIAWKREAETKLRIVPSQPTPADLARRIVKRG